MQKQSQVKAYPLGLQADASIGAIFGVTTETRIVRPLFLSDVSAGFPSPADDYIERNLDLNEHLIQNQAATFFVRVAGDSMTGAGINHGDILIVDRSLDPVSGKIIIAIVNGELTVKRLLKTADACRLIAENPAYEAMEVPTDSDFEVWGVVTFAIHQV
jgi:DNA polymerase V